MPLPEHRVFYEHPMPKGAIQIPYDGTPFVFVGKKVLGCHHGGHKSKTTRLKYEQYTVSACRSKSDGAVLSCT